MLGGFNTCDLRIEVKKKKQFLVIGMLLLTKDTQIIGNKITDRKYHPCRMKLYCSRRYILVIENNRRSWIEKNLYLCVKKKQY